MVFHTCRQAAAFQLFQHSVYGFSDFDDVRTAGSGYQYAHCALAVVEQLVACRVLVAFLYLCDVAQAQLVVVMPLDKHVADVFHGFELVVDRHTDAVVTVFVVTGIGGLVLSVQGGKHFGRFHAQIGHAILKQGDVDAFHALAVEFHAVYSLQIAGFTLDEFGIVGQFTVGQSVARQGIEHAVNIAEIIFYDRGACAFGKRGAGIVYFPAEHVPALLHIVVADGTKQFYLYQGEVVVRIALYIIYVAHGADVLFQYVRHFQFYLMGRSSRIGGDHHSQFHFYFRVFQLTHFVA